MARSSLTTGAGVSMARRGLRKPGNKPVWVVPELPCVIVLAGGHRHFVFFDEDWSDRQPARWPLPWRASASDRIVLTRLGAARSDFRWRLAEPRRGARSAREIAGKEQQATGRSYLDDLSAAGTAAILALRLTGRLLPEPEIRGEYDGGTFIFTLNRPGSTGGVLFGSYAATAGVFRSA